jgi:hypothetical protein
MDTQQIITELKSTMETDAKHISDRLKWVEGSIVELAQKGENHGGMMMPRATKSLGDQAVDAFSEFGDTFHKSGRLRLELKAAGDTVTTASGRTVMSVGAGAPSVTTLGLQNAFTGRSLTGVTAVEYSRYTGLEGAAGVQAVEGDLKAKVRPSHTIINQTALTIAATTVMSRQAMSDSVELKRAVETTLARSCAATLDAALYAGTATPLWAGFDDLATTLDSDFSNLADAVSDAQGVMQLGGFMPDVVAISPATWVQIMTLRADSGTGVYLSGNYLGTTEPVLRGLRVVLSNSVPLGSALVIDSTHIELISVQNPIIEVGTIDDQFSRNLATVLLEFRVAPIFRTVGCAVLATPQIVSE